MSAPPAGKRPGGRGAKARTPVDQLSAGMEFYARLGLDVGHFGPLWHLLKIAQRVETDLNRISGLYGLSLADFHFLGALMMEGDRPIMASDLAHLLNVSNAALTSRVRRLSDAGLIEREPAPADHRATMLRLTEAGSDRVRAIGAALEQEGLFVHYFRKLAAEDQQLLGKLLGKLHVLVERHFLPVSRPDS